MNVFASERRARRSARLVVIPIVLAALLGGVWITGGLITDDFKVAMVLTGAWIGVLGLGCLALGFKRRQLAPWILGTYVVATSPASEGS